MLLNFDIILLFSSLVDKVFFKWAFQFLLKNQNIPFKLQKYFTLVYSVLFQWAAYQSTTFPGFSAGWMPLCFAGKFCKICLQGISCLENAVRHSLKEDDKFWRYLCWLPLIVIGCHHHNFMCTSCGCSIWSVLLSAQSYPFWAQVTSPCSCQEHLFETGHTLPAKFISLRDIAHTGYGTQLVCLCLLILTIINQHCLFWFAVVSFCVVQGKACQCLVTIYISVVWFLQKYISIRNFKFLQVKKKIVFRESIRSFWVIFLLEVRACKIAVEVTVCFQPQWKPIGSLCITAAEHKHFMWCVVVI